jgi:beta-glucosidase-like glycosyl hydrolase/CubicO group peptidase (beta-lactamase class C family)
MREYGLLFLLPIFLLMTSSGRTQKSAAPSRKAAARESKWVENTLKKMSLQEKLGQLLVIYYFGEFTSTESPEYKELMRLVEQEHVGGFIVGTTRWPLGIIRSQVYPTAVLANQLQQHAKIPLLVSADFETGTAMRLDEGTSFPSAMAVAAAGNPQDAYTIGKITALEARAAGIQWIYAPVSDVNINPDNPIINIRSFGEDPKKVGEFVAAFVRGAQENGALATAKHFPGHGDVNVDSHLALSVVPGNRERLENVELVPFRAAIGAGVASIMSGHLAVPAFEPDTSLPATLSPNILTGLLRGELGYTGLVATDAMDMGGVTTLFPPGEAAVRSILAGADVLLMPPVPDAALAVLEEAVKSGRLPIAHVDESVRRILSAKEKLGLVKNRFVNIDKINEKFGRPEFAAQAQDIADRGVTLLRDEKHLLPLDSAKPLRVLYLAISGDADVYPGYTLENEIRWRVDSLEVIRVDTKFERADLVKLPPESTYDAILIGLFVRVADRKGTVGLPDDEAALVNQLLGSGKPAIVACLGSPYLIERFPNAPTWLAEFSTNEVSQRAVGRTLFGQSAIGGAVPVTLPAVAKLGDGLKVGANPMALEAAPVSLSGKLKPAYEILDRAVSDHAFPGGVLAVGYQNQLILHPFGKLTYEAGSGDVSAETIYDVASLTKAVVTTTAIMMLTASGRVQLDLPLDRYIPEWDSGPNPEVRKQVTVRELLLHTSGLPAHQKYYEQVKGTRQILARICAEPLASEPGTKIEYSDLGFILLGEIVERLTGETLDQYAQEQIFAQLDMNNTLFNPPKKLVSRIAPTENDTTFRKRILQGEVDDSNAYAMGGVAGHAGLFSTASDLSAFAQMMLNGGIYKHHRLFTRSLIEEFTTRQSIGDSARDLGWDTPTEPSSSGQYFSKDGFGHIGYTGTSLWIDPEKSLFVILLTNRVYPSASNDKIRQVRPMLHDSVVESLGLAVRRTARR